jgi:hypothetical protein
LDEIHSKTPVKRAHALACDDGEPPKPVAVTREYGGPIKSELDALYHNLKPGRGLTAWLID